jgi:Zn-dependent peptidase ImmA (M78 family)
MTLPKQIKIVGMVYPVTEENLDDGETYYYGKVDYMTPRIRIEQTMAYGVKVQALIHEIFHALCHHTGHVGYDHEEQFAHMLGCQLPVLLRENRELVQAILDSE